MNDLKQIRVNLAKQGRTLTEIANEIGITRGMLYYYINRKQPMPAEVLKKLKEQKLI